MASTQGIHHVTAITAHLDRHLDFYSRILGLRLVKRTVNFDDPASYHLYYGDATGRPGSLLTFFVWPSGRPGRAGTGVVGAVALAVPPGSMGFWFERLISNGIRTDAPGRRMGESVLEFADPDGMRVELVGAAAATIPGWERGPVPSEHGVRSLHGVTIWEERDEGHARTLQEVLGLRPVGEDGNRVRFASASSRGAVVDLRRVGGFWRGLSGPGVVHHVAFRAADDREQEAFSSRAADGGLRPTPQLDRRYFRSVYFRQPHGVLFEVATAEPGFLVDETEATLGSKLQLPPWLEGSRAELEAALPALDAWHAPGVP